MFQGYYNLASNMITQNRNLNVISTNMTNMATPGYKADKLMQSTFREEMLYRHDHWGQTKVGTASWINIADERITDYSDGGIRETASPLDFALEGSGFFVIQGENGPVYTRDGSFILDDQGYLTLPTIGRVMGTNGPIQLPTDDISLNEQGEITSADGWQNFGKLQIVDFDDYSQLVKVTGSVFEGTGTQVTPNVSIRQKFIESSNVSLADEITNMISSQRALQSSSQLLRMYDQLISKALTTGVV